MEKARQTGVNQLVRECLARLVEERSRRRLARARLRKVFETGLVDAGDRKRSRDDLCDIWPAVRVHFPEGPFLPVHVRPLIVGEI